MDTAIPAASDAAHLARALALAERGRGSTWPNPIVGCVITREGEVVGEGWHQRLGGPHAEAVALADAGGAATGGTVHVTLEPCDHHGLTPPCSEALVRAGVARVVYGLADPNPAARGGAATLAGAGIDVSAHPLGGYVREQNRVFLAHVAAGRPHLCLKLAQTPEGQLTPPAGRWITGPVARQHVHRLRSRADAVLVGSGTVLADDPRLDVRHTDAPTGQPRAVVLDSRGRTPVDAAVVRRGTVVVTVTSAPGEWRSRLEAAGVEVVVTGTTAAGQVDVAAALDALGDLGVHSILAEPGAGLASSLVAAGVVDRVVLHVAGGAAPVRFASCLAPRDDHRWRTVMSRPLGRDRELVLVPEEV